MQKKSFLWSLPPLRSSSEAVLLVLQQLQAINFSGDIDKVVLATLPPTGDEDEEEMLKRAIAMSLEEQ